MPENQKIRGRVGPPPDPPLVAEPSATESPQDVTGGAQPPPTGDVGIRRVPTAKRPGKRPGKRAASKKGE